MFSSGVYALWDSGGLYHAIRHSDRLVASNASKCDILQCTTPPELERTHTHTVLTPATHLERKMIWHVYPLFTKSIEPPQPPSVYMSVQKLLGLGEGEFVPICITNQSYV